MSTLKTITIFVIDRRFKTGYRVQLGCSCMSFYDDWVCKTIYKYVTPHNDGYLYLDPGVRILYGIKEVMLFTEDYEPIFYSSTDLVFNV